MDGHDISSVQFGIRLNERQPAGCLEWQGIAGHSGEPKLNVLLSSTHQRLRVAIPGRTRDEFAHHYESDAGRRYDSSLRQRRWNGALAATVRGLDGRRVV